MVYQKKLAIATVLIGTGFAVIMAVIAHQLAYNIAPAMLGWAFGVLAMGTVVRCDNYLSTHATTGGE